MTASPARRSARRRLPAKARSPTPLRVIFAWTLSLVFVVVGMALALCGATLAIVAVVKAVQEVDVGAWIASALGLVVGLALALGGLRVITRVRPSVVQRLSGVDVPPVPALFAAMWNNSSGGYFGGGLDGGGGGDCGGGGDGGGGGSC